MAILKLSNDPESPGVLFAGIKTSDKYIVPRIPIYSMIIGKKVTDVPISQVPLLKAQTIHNSKRENVLVKHLRNLLLIALMFLLGIDYAVINELESISRNCKVGRNFVKCSNLVLTFGKAGILYYILSRAKGSETRAETAKYLALRRRGLLTVYISGLFSRASSFQAPSI